MTYNSGATDVLLKEGEYQIVDRPLAWQLQGVQQTASGYGRKLTSTRMIVAGKRSWRVYVTIFSNSGTAYIVSKGRKYLVPDYGGDIVGWGPYVEVQS